MKERFGAEDPKSQMIRFHTQTGGVTLTAQQPVNNIVRVALQAFAAVSGGTQSLHTNGYDEALALPSERAAKIALRTQQIVAHESGADRHGRPVRRLLLRRGADGRDRGARAEADRAASTRWAARSRRSASSPPRSTSRPGATPSATGIEPGHRRRRQQVRGGRRRGRGDPARRPRVRARRRSSGSRRSRPTATRSVVERPPRRAARGRRGHGQPAARTSARAEGQRLAGRGLPPR